MNISTHDKTILQEKNFDLPKKKWIMCKRKFATYTAWILSFIISGLLFAFSTLFVAIVTSSILFLVTGLLSVLLHYIKTHQFPESAYVLLIISYLIGFAKLILVPLSISLSMTRDPEYIGTKENGLNSIDYAWKVLYWTSIVLNFILIPSICAYWRQAHPTFAHRVKHAAISLSKNISLILGISIFLFTVCIIQFPTLTSYADMIGSVIEAMNFIFTNAHLLLLLGYGLAIIPYYFFTYTNTTSQLKLLIPNLESYHNDFEVAVNKLMVDKTILIEVCGKVLSKNYPNKELRINTVKFAKFITIQLQKLHLAFNDLVKYQDVKGNITTTISDSTNIGQDVLSDMFTIVKQDFYTARRKEAALLRLYDKIRRNSQLNRKKEIIPQFHVAETEASLSETMHSHGENIAYIRDSIITNKALGFFNTEAENSIIPYKYSMFTNIITKLTGACFIPITLLIFAVQINLFVIEKFNLMVWISDQISFNFYVNYLLIFGFCSYMFICCLYALSKYRIFEGYILIPHHTDKFGMISNAGLCDTLILGICYNIIYIYSIGNSHLDDMNKSKTVFNFFKSMYEMLFMTKVYNYVFPTLLILIALITLLARTSLFKFKIRGLEERYNSENNALPEKKDVINFNLIENIEKTYFAGKE